VKNTDNIYIKKNNKEANMRKKDESKKEAIFEATISLLNEIGFYQISMSKIAKRAGVSSATIYVYFENKDDMIRKLYLDVNAKFGSFLVQTLDDKKSVKQNIEAILRRTFDFIVKNKDYYLFLEQFSNSPLVQNFCVENMNTIEAIGAITKIYERGKKEGVLKQVDSSLLMEFTYSPIAQLAKSHLAGNIKLTEKKLQSVVEMSWNAIQA
jgi:AcrR family transcriptional regulator